ncbi:hypothetical protein [Bacillus sp. ISTL8]|uniref:hypothetical protein n=1 Tax=Bacillus sp. ISTL8 TaxID=2596896 RepID=UPI00145733D3|nr:hypothetical protein [Bacillus sp. ISTL8]
MKKMKSIQIIQGDALKDWFETGNSVEVIKAYRGIGEYIIEDLAEIDDDTYYYIADVSHKEIIIKEVVIADRAYQIDMYHD